MRLASAVFSLLAVLSARAWAAPSAACAGPFTQLGASAQGGGVTARPVTTRCQRVAFDRMGTPTVMWGDSSTGAPEVYWRQWSGQAWVGLGGSDVDGGLSRHSGVADSSGYHSCPGHVAFDSLNRPNAVWMNYDGNEQYVYLRRFNNGLWEELGGSASGTGLSDTAGGYWPTIGIDALDRIAVFWTEGPRLLGLQWSGSAWTEMAGSGSIPGIAGPAANVYIHSSDTRPSGNQYVAWSDLRRPSNPEIRLLQWNGTAWTGLGNSNADGGLAAGDRPSVVDDGSGRPFMTWAAPLSDGGTVIQAARWNGVSWVNFPPPTMSGQNVGSAIDRNGEIFSIYEELIPAGTAVRLVHWTGTVWENCPLGFSDTGGSTWPAVALGPNNEIAVSWSEEVSPGNYQGYVLVNLLPDAGADAGPGVVAADAGDAGDTGDAGANPDGGDGGIAPKAYTVGCGCSGDSTMPAALGAFAVLAILLWGGRLSGRRSYLR